MLIQLVVALIVLGLVMYVIETLLPLDATIKRLIHVVLVVIVCLWLLSAFGLLGSGPLFKVN